MKQNLIITTILIVFILLAGIGIAFTIHIHLTYGNMPPEEVPAWVWWFMLGR